MPKEISVTKVAALNGEIRVPSDKSLTHRGYMLASIASGPCVVRHPLRGEDCESTRNCLIQMGLRHEELDAETFRLIPAAEWNAPPMDLDCGNSGTTVRLMSGLIASRSIKARLVGDTSLSRRPMKRIAEPLRSMGAVVEGDTLPLLVQGGDLTGIDYISPVASAQVKSCLLLAGLRASGVTSVSEPSLSRDHTERMLTATGVKIERDGLKVSIQGGQQPSAFDFEIPADISSAAFVMVAAAVVPGSRVVCQNVGVNPSRTGILDVLLQAGVPFELSSELNDLNEPSANIEVHAPRMLKPFRIEGPLVPRLIDEIPVLAVLATQCEGTTVIKDAAELKVKESDRIKVVADALNRMGAKVNPTEDGMVIEGPTPLTGITVDSLGDHRIGMAFAIAGLIADGATTILNADSIDTSFPGFERELQRLCII